MLTKTNHEDLPESRNVLAALELRHAAGVVQPVRVCAGLVIVGPELLGYLVEWFDYPAGIYLVLDVNGNHWTLVRGSDRMEPLPD